MKTLLKRLIGIMPEDVVAGVDRGAHARTRGSYSSVVVSESCDNSPGSDRGVPGFGLPELQSVVVH